jgi:hypothetical protein
MEALRIVLLVFFATHIPATLLVDAQAGAQGAKRSALARACSRGQRPVRQLRA